MPAKKKRELPSRRLRVTKSHDGLDLDDIVTVHGEPDPRTASLLGAGYFEWADPQLPSALPREEPPEETTDDAGNE